MSVFSPAWKYKAESADWYLFHMSWSVSSLTAALWSIDFALIRRCHSPWDKSRSVLAVCALGLISWMQCKRLQTYVRTGCYGTAGLASSCLGKLSSHLDLLSVAVSAGRCPLMFRGESHPWKSHFVSAKKGHCGFTAGVGTWSFPDTAEQALRSCIFEWLNWKNGILSKTSAVAEGFLFPLLSYLVKLSILCK